MSFDLYIKSPENRAKHMIVSRDSHDPRVLRFHAASGIANNIMFNMIYSVGAPMSVEGFLGTSKDGC